MKTLCSGSSGNCYILENKDGKKLILDIGISKKDLMKGLDFDVKNIAGVVITHSHGDHLNPRTMDELQMMGIRIINPWQNEKEIDAFVIDGFKIHSFHVFHDGTPCCGFMIVCDGDAILYVTDAEYVKYNFKKFKPRAILFECNYQEEYVDMESENMAHIFRGHASLDTCIDFLKANATDNLRHVVLCHLSKVNANPEECQMAVCKAIPNVMVHVADKGMEINL